MYKNKIATLLEIVALTFSTLMADSFCFFIFHQPSIPEEVKKLRHY